MKSNTNLPDPIAEAKSHIYKLTANLEALASWRKLGNLFSNHMLTYDEFVAISQSAKKQNSYALHTTFPSDLKSPAQLAAHCFQQPLLLMQNFVKDSSEQSKCANDLGVLFSINEKLPIYNTVFPEGYAKKHDNNQLAAYCFARSLMLQSPPVHAWNNLALAFYNSASVKALPPNFIGQLKIPTTSSLHAAEYCFQRTCNLLPLDQAAEQNLLLVKDKLNNTFFSRTNNNKNNHSSDDSYEHEKTVIHAEISPQITAICFANKLSINVAQADAWKNLGIAFTEGADLQKLPRLFAENYFSCCLNNDTFITNYNCALKCFEIAILYQPDLIHDESITISRKKFMEEISHLESNLEYSLSSKRNANVFFQSQMNDDFEDDEYQPKNKMMKK